jgi:hypothetical protein
MPVLNPGEFKGDVGLVFKNFDVHFFVVGSFKTLDSTFGMPVSLACIYIFKR